MAISCLLKTIFAIPAKRKWDGAQFVKEYMLCLPMKRMAIPTLTRNARRA
jgi:hypothetical protein